MDVALVMVAVVVTVVLVMVNFFSWAAAAVLVFVWGVVAFIIFVANIFYEVAIWLTRKITGQGHRTR